VIGGMIRRIVRKLYPVLMFMSGIVFACTGAISSSLPYNKSVAAAAVLYQASTPTPLPGTGSQAGSTDGIMLMGVVIVIIVLLPILLRRSTWTK
jgi:hypothetical protein